MANGLAQLMKFFGVSAAEMREFWASLSTEEKEYYNNAELDV